MTPTPDPALAARLAAIKHTDMRMEVLEDAYRSGQLITVADHERTVQAAVAKAVEAEQALQTIINHQRQELAKLNSVVAARSKQLDAMAWVWCSGCDSGIFQKNADLPRSDLTEELVLLAETNTKRLRTWLSNHNFRKLPMAVRLASFKQPDRENWMADQYDLHGHPEVAAAIRARKGDAL